MSDREETRRLVRELLSEALANGATPQVPPPPVAAVHRPSSWSQPAAPGEVIGNGASARTEVVRIENDADLAAFVSTVLDHGEAIRQGRLRFTLGRDAASAAGIIRVAHGAVTERKIKQAADAGARLVLGPGAVLTPLAREKARALGIDIERER
jgi:hypothetical protein